METERETWQRNRMYQMQREQSNSFLRSYHCYSSNSPFVVDTNQAAQIETGDKIIMPASALHDLSSLMIDYPMLFQVENPASSSPQQRVSHCGVWEFTATEGHVYMPYWMMQNLHLRDGDIVRIKNVSLPKGTFVKLQPHTKDFLDMSNPRAVLERTLRSFTCLTTGDTIKLSYNGKDYYVNILESKPSNAVSIVETDCEVDFAPPLDYVKLERPVTAKSVPLTNKAALPDLLEEPKFSAFTGAGRRLDGKPSDTSSKGTSSRAPGKLVFGSNATSGPKETRKEASKEQAKLEKNEDQPKFQPFTGKKYSLI